MKKKKWIKPKLIILTRGKPEERVLVSCKNRGSSGSGPTNADTLCDMNDGGGGCAYCDVSAPS